MTNHTPYRDVDKPKSPVYNYGWIMFFVCCLMVILFLAFRAHGQPPASQAAISQEWQREIGRLKRKWQLEPHAWAFDSQTGKIEYYDVPSGKFRELVREGI